MTGNAKIAGFEKDLGLKGYDYNIVLTIFYISYIVFEIPSNILCKMIGPGWFLPATSLGFGLASLCTAFTHNKAQVAAVRFVLGIFEAGMFPGIAYYLSRWYRHKELTFRLSMYLVMAPLAGAFGGLLASGILKLPHFGGLHTWRMLFAIEGIITSVISIIAFITLTDRPASAKWLTQEERDLAIARVKSERVGTTEVLDKIDSTKLLRGIFSPVTLSTAMIFLLNNITVQGLAFFAPTIVETIYPKKTTIQLQIQTVPPYVVGGFFVLFFSWCSTRYDRRSIFFIFSIPLAMIGYVIFLATTNGQARYAATFLVAAGAYSFGSMCNSQVSANVVSDTARAGSIATNVMFGNVGGLISTWSFLPFDAPNYHIGNGLNLATTSTILLLSIALLWWMKMDNKRRDSKDQSAELLKLNEMSTKQVQDLDWKHPAFRWRP